MDIDDIVEILADIRSKNILVIVEGKKDERSLAELGISNVLTLGPPLFEVVELVASKAKEVVLLVDLDVEGKKLYSSLSKDLMKHGVKIDDRLRKALFRSDVRHIEGLSSFIHKHYKGSLS